MFLNNRLIRVIEIKVNNSYYILKKRRSRVGILRQFYIISNRIMNIKTYNKSLAELAKKALNFAFVRQTLPEDDEVFFCNDTDSVKYRIVARLQIVTLYLFAVDTKTIWDYCHEHFKSRYYQFAKVKLTHLEQSNVVQIVIDNDVLTQYNQNFVSKQEVGITTGKKKFDALFQYLSKKLASVKRHFFASPFEMMLDVTSQNSATKGSKTLPHLCYSVRAGDTEKVWIVFEKNQFSVFYGVSFEDRSQQQLSKILFSELIDSMKHVHNPPSVSVNESELPKSLTQAFPAEKKKKYTFSNGIVCFTIFGSLVKKPQSMATYLAGFRTYVYYHIQAQKCYLHSRILRRINGLHKDFSHTKIEPFALN